VPESCFAPWAALALFDRWVCQPPGWQRTSVSESVLLLTITER